MKRYMIGLTMAVMLLFCGIASSATWSQLSQTQKNNAIAQAGANSVKAWNSTHYDPNQGNCFVWASSAVLTASGGVRSLPWQTMQPNPSVPVTISSTIDSWYWVPNAGSPNSAPALVNAFPGHVVQMNLTSGIPHTVVYMGYSGSTLYFTNANFPSNTVSGTIPPAYNNGVWFTNGYTFTWSFNYFNTHVRDYTINVIH